MHAYCLFCETQRCRQIAEYIRKTCGYQCFSPQLVQRKWVKGIMTETSHDWLPGYLFLYTEEPTIRRFNIDGIIRILGKGELEGQDRQFAEMIYHREGVMGTIPLIQEGGRCRIKDPAWENLQGKVVKLDRERKRCCVSFEFDGQIHTVWAGYEIIRTE